MATLFYAKDFVTAAGAGKIVFHKGAQPLSTINNNNAIVRRAPPPPFLDHMRIFLAIIRAVGLFPMKLPSSSEEYPQISYVAFTYSLCLYSIIMYHIIIIYSHSIPRVVAPNQAFNVVLYIVGNLALIHTFTLIPFSHWCSAKQYTALVIRWSKFLKHFENTYGYRPNLKTKKIVFAGIFGSTLLLVSMSIAVRFGVPGKIFVLSEVCGLIIILSTSAIFYAIFCSNMQIVSDSLCSTFRQDGPPSLLAIRNALDIWMQLSAMIKAMNSTLNMNTSISLIITTTSGALASFGLVIKLLKKNEPDVTWFMSFLFQIADTTSIYILCNSAEKATKRLGENVRRRILSCDFSQATFHELQQIFSVLATYMIVLVQFQMTMPYQTV